MVFNYDDLDNFITEICYEQIFGVQNAALPILINASINIQYYCIYVYMYVYVDYVCVCVSDRLPFLTLHVFIYKTVWGTFRGS